MLNLHIENFKSIDGLDLELGRVNLFIGENGCGKSNILEALGMAAAGVSSNLSPAALMVLLYTPQTGFSAHLTHDNTPYGHWANRPLELLDPLLELGIDSFGADADAALATLQKFSASVQKTLADSWKLPELPSALREDPQSARQWFIAAAMLAAAMKFHLTEFLAYAPREDVLRDLARDSDVEPIGVHGEGLFKLLQVLDGEGQLPEVKEQLALLGWFDDLAVAAGVNPSSRALQIRDVFPLRRRTTRT